LEDPDVSNREISKVIKAEHEMEVKDKTPKIPVISIKLNTNSEQSEDDNSQKSQELTKLNLKEVQSEVSEHEQIVEKVDPHVSQVTTVTEQADYKGVIQEGKEDLDTDFQINQTIDEIDVTDTQNQTQIQNLIDEDINEMENIVNSIDQSLKQKIKEEKQESSVLEKTVIEDKPNDMVEFEEGEQLKFINRIDNEGIEYLSMEINFNLINPEDFGFKDFKKSDQEALEQKVQEHFIAALQNDQEMQKLGLKVYGLI
jgi:hypothetical protein